MDKEKKDLLVFGYGLGLIAAVFGVIGGIKHGWQGPPLVLLCCSLVFMAVTAFDWKALRPGYRGWMKVAHVIGGIITAFILTLVFFLVFAPVGILFRLIGKDHLDRKLDPKARTYWNEREQVPFSQQRYFQQF